MTDLSVANEIMNQIGNRAAAMLAIHDAMGTERGVQFAIRGSRKVNKFVVVLESTDTYSVTAYRGRGVNCRSVDSVSGVFALNLRGTLGELSGLAVSL